MLRCLNESLEKDINDSYKYLKEYKELKHWLNNQGDNIYQSKSTKISDIPTAIY